MRLQQMLRGQRLPPIPHLLSVMVQPKPVSIVTGCHETGGLLHLSSTHVLCYLQQHPNPEAVVTDADATDAVAAVTCTATEVP